MSSEPHRCGFSESPGAWQRRLEVVGDKSLLSPPIPGTLSGCPQAYGCNDTELAMIVDLASRAGDLLQG